jgi:hypothetical protein
MVTVALRATVVLSVGVVIDTTGGVLSPVPGVAVAVGLAAGVLEGVGLAVPTGVLVAPGVLVATGVGGVALGVGLAGTAARRSVRAGSCPTAGQSYCAGAAPARGSCHRKA